MMEKSSRFTSLSGLSFIAAGVCAFIGAFFAYRMIMDVKGDIRIETDPASVLSTLRRNLIFLAAGVFALAVLTAFYFTWNKSKKQGISLFGHTSRRAFWNFVLPLGAGGLFVFGLVYYNDWRFVVPGSLIFYGLALVNASKYTLSDISYLGYCQVAVGLISMIFIGYGYYFWLAGFGVLHILYGIIMWMKYDRGGTA